MTDVLADDEIDVDLIAEITADAPPAPYVSGTTMIVPTKRKRKQRRPAPIDATAVRCVHTSRLDVTTAQCSLCIGVSVVRHVAPVMPIVEVPIVVAPPAKVHDRKLATEINTSEAAVTLRVDASAVNRIASALPRRKLGGATLYLRADVESLRDRRLAAAERAA
ncbi:MAG: hypothetical protein ABI591_21575 [Kofleriaceae bacterium]